MSHKLLRCLLMHTHADNNRFICWQKRCIVETNPKHLCKFVEIQSCVLAAQGKGEQGKLFCGIFLVAVHEKFNGLSVCTSPRRIKRVQSVLGCIFKWVSLGFWPLILLLFLCYVVIKKSAAKYAVKVWLIPHDHTYKILRSLLLY